MDLSIIIPCHNLEEYIEPCINSLLSQKNNLNIKREIIFICDKCTDNTRKIIEDMVGGGSWPCTIITASAGSPGGARNIGLEKATGKYIWFVDGDDWLTCSNAIDTLYAEMQDKDLDILEFKIKSRACPQGEFGTGTV
jgi:glycosyltransferase involved in cell wall biosynthesis